MGVIGALHSSCTGLLTVGERLITWEQLNIVAKYTVIRLDGRNKDEAQ